MMAPRRNMRHLSLYHPPPTTHHSLLQLILINLRWLRLVPLGGPLFVAGLGQRADDAETDVEGVGEVPDALRELRVLLLPVFGGADAGGAATAWRVVVPGAAADHPGILFERNRQRLLGQTGGLALGIEVGRELIEAP